MTRDDLFNVCTCSSSLPTHLIKFHADKCIYCPPVPIVAKTLKTAGVFDPRRVFGVTTLDVVCAVRFLGEVTRNDPKNIIVPVIGGHSGATIVPLLSQNPYGKAVTGDDYAKLVYRIQYDGDEVVKAKDGAGSPTLSEAYAGAKFTNTLLRGLNGEKGGVTPTSVKSDIFADKGVDFVSSNVELGVCVFFKFDLD
jgi:malate dehydrogenase